MKKILITGAAGFIGFHLSQKLLIKKYKVLGIDNLNSYYSVKLKKDRLGILKKYKNFSFMKVNLEDKKNILKIYKKFKPKIVINLAAQAGVRYSLKNPEAYAKTNLIGFFNILDACRIFKVSHLIYASTSSVYGANKKLPFHEFDIADHPIQFYAATKRSNELMAHSYSELYKIKTTGLRFFTVYGPWGRPDMAPMIFANAILNDKPLSIFNYGKMSRSFTFIDDAILILTKLINKPALPDKLFDPNKPKSSSSWCPYRILNIGSDSSIELMEFINALEQEFGLEAKKDFMPMQKGDVINTLADNKLINEWIGHSPKTFLRKGVKIFVDWYKDYYIK